LGGIANMKGFDGIALRDELKASVDSAQKLSEHLSNAFNVKTGNFDLGKLDTSLKNSGTNLGELSAKLLNAGTAGEQAFMDI
jgi:hypothetical protein